MLSPTVNGQPAEDGGGGLPQELETIEGVVERVVFRNAVNGYTVCGFRPLEGGEPLNVVGKFVAIAEGMPLTLRGKWTSHAKYGKQFTVEDYHADIPRSEVGLRHYLTGFIKGVGPVMAKRIVKRFGEDAIDIIENHPKRLREVEGIGRAKAEQIVESWREQNRIKDVMMFLQSNNVSHGYALKIFNTYGERSVEVLRQDPYVLSSDIIGIGFKIADRIALSIGHEKDSRMRLRAGLMYVLKEAVNDGHVFLPVETMLDDSARILEAPRENVEAVLKDAVAIEGVIIEDEGRIYLASYHFSEKTVANKLAKMIKWQKSRKTRVYTDAEKRGVESALGFALSEEQRSVMDVLSAEPVVVLTGGPGTGKTVTTKAVITLFERAGAKVLLAAPTGRASKRLSEATGRPARTLHRLLEFKTQGFRFEKNEENPLDAHLIVVDEMSMVDILLMHHFLKAVKLTTKLLLVGDIDQLPSVGAGNILRDLIASGEAATVRLGRIFRQQEGSSIIENAHRINIGEMPNLSARGDNANFFFQNREDPQDALESILSLCTTKIPEKFKLDPMTDIQVISPMYRGVAGVDNLNKLLQDRLNPAKDIQCGPRSFRIGDRVMQIRNNYDKEVYNGDVGLIRHINIEDGKISVKFPEQTVMYDFSDSDQLVPAYAITVHKSQGTEYPAVVLPLSTQHYPMLQRNLLYTAITRAKTLVVIVGSVKAVALAVKNNKIEERHSALAGRLADAIARKDLLDA